MLEGGKISGRQAVYLLIVTMLPISISFLPHLMYTKARQDVWLSIILVTVLGGLLEYIAFPSLVLTRLIAIGLIENVELLILLTWILGGVLKIALLHYCSTLATAQLLNLKNYRPLMVINAFILMPLAAWSFRYKVGFGWEDRVELINIIAAQGVPFFLFVQVGLPLLLLIVAVIRGKRGKKNAH